MTEQATHEAADLPQNIVLFNLAALKILTDLYEEFPCPFVLEATRIASDLRTESGSDIDGDLLVEIVQYSVQWLLDEGYIRKRTSPDRLHSRLEDPSLVEAVLSDRGLALLGRPIRLCGDKPETFYRQAKSLLSTTAQQAVERGLVDLFAQGSMAVGKLVGMSIGADVG